MTGAEEHDSRSGPDSTDPDVWLTELPGYQGRTVRELIEATGSYDAALDAWLDTGTAGNTAAFGGGPSPAFRRFRELFLDEAHDLLCREDRYESVRADLLAGIKAGKGSTVAALTAVLASALEAAPTFVAPAAALVLAAVSSMGLAAWCKLQAERREGRDGDHDPGS